MLREVTRMYGLKRIMVTASVSALMAVGGGLSNEVQASTVTVMQGFSSENDCSGFFGQGFGSCNIFINDDDGTKIELSPVIAKYDSEDSSKNEFNTALYPSINGNEFSFTVGTTGTWTYNQGTGDPSVKYWAAKGSNAFNLFWTVNETATQAGGACTGGNLYTLSCLQEALAVTTGGWETPLNKQGNNSGLSHLTFYDSVPPTVVVPVPAAGILLITALGGLGVAARRRRKSS